MMKFQTLAVSLFSLALAAPTERVNGELGSRATAVPELSVSQWSWVQSSFGGLSKLSELVWDKAEEIVGSDVSNEDGGKGDESKTIWQQLKEDPNSFSKLVKIIENDQWQGEASKYLDGKADHITFFAPNNDALTPPKHEHHHHGHHGHHDHDGDDEDEDEDELIAQLYANPSLASISSLLEADPSLMTETSDEPDDDEKKRRRELIKKLVGKVLMYHSVAEPLTAVDVAKNSTLKTVLEAGDGSYGGQFRRLKVKKTLVPPAVRLNFYAQILATDRKASNGYFHTLGAPLIPPPSIFDLTYLSPDFYSTFTSAAQGLGESNWIKWEYHPSHDHDEFEDFKPFQDSEESEDVEDDDGWSEYMPEEYEDLDDMLSHYANELFSDLHLGKSKVEGHFSGTPLATVFVPTNSAFAILPPRLKLYLFSPFGRRALARILGYHYLFDTLLLTEFQYKGDKYPNPGPDDIHKDGVDYTWNEVVLSEDGDGYFHKEFDLTTAINETIHIEIEKKKVLPIEGAVKTTLKVNGIETLENDVPAQNGAWHPIGLILVPPHHHHDAQGQDISHTDSWNNWEEWLPQWADEE